MSDSSNPSKRVRREGCDADKMNKVIDGSMLEGGGQILRNAAALAAITSTAITVNSIRAKRSKSGLRPQHLTGLQLVSSISNGVLEGGSVGSTEISLCPELLQCGNFTGDTGTAGSCMLLAQSALPCLLFASPGKEGETKSHLELRGGTDAPMAPPIGYFEHILLPTLRRALGVSVQLELKKRGFFPRGGGMVSVDVETLDADASLPPIILKERGKLIECCIMAFTAGRVGISVAERMAHTAQEIIKKRMKRCNALDDMVVELQTSHEPPERAIGDGCGILLVAKTDLGVLLGASGLGERGVPAEIVGQRAADELMDVLESGACVDDWLMDQLIVFMAVADGQSVVMGREPSLHTRTAIEVAQELTSARFRCVKIGQGEEELWKVECTGAGLKRQAEIEIS